jgi:hypothetical protein
VLRSTGKPVSRLDLITSIATSAIGQPPVLVQRRRDRRGRRLGRDWDHRRVRSADPGV